MLINIKTRMACRALPLPNFNVDVKTSKHSPDTFLIEYKTFFKLMSYYLPLDELKNNKHFVNWLRKEENLAY